MLCFILEGQFYCRETLRHGGGKAKRGFASIYLLCGQSKFDMRFALDMHTLRCVDMPCKQGVIFLLPRYTAKARPNFRYRHSDKTRAYLRFAKIHSKANAKSSFCQSESLASTHPPQAVPQVCNANFQDALHPYSPLQGKA